jgi:hypothetical protein
MSRLARIKALEKTGQRQNLSSCLQLLPGESVDEALKRGSLAGLTGGVLIVSEPMTTDEWTAVAAAQQAELTRG